MNAIRKINGVLRCTDQTDYILEDSDGRIWLLDFERFTELLVDERLYEEMTVEGVQLGENWIAVEQMESADAGPLALRPFWTERG